MVTGRRKKTATTDMDAWFKQAANENEANRAYCWFQSVASKTCNMCQLNNNIFKDSSIKDDIIDAFLVDISKDEQRMYEIYVAQNIPLVEKMVKRYIYKFYGELSFKNKMDFSRYQRIVETCNKYHIPMSERNAYKISELMDEKNKLSIPVIMTLIRTKKPNISSYDSEESFNSTYYKKNKSEYYDSAEYNGDGEYNPSEDDF